MINGQEVSGNIFCNRVKEIRELLMDIRSGQNVIIYSPRRYGKTSLIKEVLRKAEKEGIVGIYANMYAVLKEDDFVSIYATSISKTLTGPIEKIISKLKNIFRSLRPKIVISSQGEMEVSVDLIKDTNLMIVDVAECHPYYVQHLGSSIRKLVRNKRFDEKIIDGALTLTLAEEKNAYSNIWDNLTLNQKKVLKMFKVIIHMACFGKVPKLNLIPCRLNRHFVH